MIIGTSANYDAVASGTDVTGVAWRVQMTLPTGPYSDVSLAVESLEIDASTQGDMPEDTRLQVGFPAMQATVVLSGMVDPADESKSAAWLFNPYAPFAADGVTRSPMYRHDALYAPITMDAGLATDAAAGTSTQGAIEWVRKFTGYVDTCVVNADGSVTLTCLESMRQLLRGQATLPPLFNVSVSAEYLIDAMLRADTAGAVSSWPAQVNEPLLSVGFRAAPLAEVGDLFNDYGSTYAPGVFGSALAGATDLTFAPFAFSGGPNTPPHVAADYFLHTPYVLGGNSYGTYPATFTSPNLFVDFWVNGDFSTVFPQILIGRAPSGNLGGTWSPNWIRLTVKSTGLVVESSLFATQTWSTTVTAGAHFVSLWMESNTISSTLDITVTLDGTQHQFTRLAVNIGGTARNYLAVGWSAKTGIASTIEALRASHNTSNHSSVFLGAYPFAPRAVLDPSLNASVRVINEVTGDTYSVIQQLCGAEEAVAGGDEAGNFRSYNRDTLRSATSVRTVTSAASLVAVGGIQSAAASVKNHCTVDWSGWDLADTASIVYQASSPIRVPAGQSIVLTPTLNSPAVLYGNVSSGSFAILPDGGTASGFWLRASTTKGGAREFPDYNKLYRTVRQTATDKLEITLTNKSASEAWLVSPAGYLDMPAGTPLLRISGYVWSQTSGTVDVQYPFAADGGAAASRFGDQPHQVSGNPWIQDAGTAYSLATDIVSDLATPRPDLTGVEIVPDPRLQLADVIRLQDPDWTGVDEYARIFGWKITWDASNYTMTLDARTLAPPGGWIMGVPGRSEIGSTAYVYSSV